MLRGRKFGYKVLLGELFGPCISQRGSSWDAINKHLFVNEANRMLLTHRSLHWNLKLWFILFRIPVPSVGENLVRMIKIDRNTRRFIFLEFIGCTENGLSLVSETQYNFKRVFIFLDDDSCIIIITLQY